MDEELLNGLKFLGLSGNDAKIYCALLRLPDASAYQLSKKTGIHRSNTYDSLNRLVEKGLSSYTFVNNVKRYTSVEPSQISSKIVDQANKIGSIINQYNQTEKPHIQVRIFEGAKGLSQVYQDIINSGHDYYALGATGKIYDLLKDEYEVFVRKRVEKKMHLFAIFDETKKNKKITKFKNISSRYMPSGLVSPINTTVYGEKVALYVWSSEINSPTVIVIESKITSQAFKSYFDMMWGIAKP